MLEKSKCNAVRGNIGEESSRRETRNGGKREREGGSRYILVGCFHCVGGDLLEADALGRTERVEITLHADRSHHG